MASIERKGKSLEKNSDRMIFRISNMYFVNSKNDLSIFSYNEIISLNYTNMCRSHCISYQFDRAFRYL